jgi:hypothetical protein
MDWDLIGDKLAEAEKSYKTKTKLIDNIDFPKMREDILEIIKSYRDGKYQEGDSLLVMTRNILRVTKDAEDRMF